MKFRSAKAIAGLAVAGMLAATLVACGSSEEDPLVQSPTTDTSQPETDASDDASEADDADTETPEADDADSDGDTTADEVAEGTITLYTSQPDADVAEMVSAFNDAYPDVTVDVFRSGTEEVLSKIRAEQQAGASQADVIFIADALSMEGLKLDDVLAQYSSPEAADFDAQYVDPEGFYTGTKIIATGLAINTDLVTERPTSWSVLTSPEAKDVAEMASPLYSGAAAYNVSVLAADPDFGWDFWQAVADNGMTVTKGNGAVLQDVAAGDKKYGMVVGFIVARAAAEGSPVEFLYPEEGVLAITEPIALAAGAKNPVAAKAFIDFVLSEAGQEVASSLGYVPIRAGAPVPAGLQGVDELTLLEGDLSSLLATSEADKEKFAEMFNQ